MVLTNVTEVMKRRRAASSESRLFAIERSENERKGSSERRRGWRASPQSTGQWYNLGRVDGKGTPISSESQLFAIERSEISKRRAPSVEITHRRWVTRAKRE